MSAYDDDYMNSQYGSIDKAYKFWNENHWY